MGVVSAFRRYQNLFNLPSGSLRRCLATSAPRNSDSSSSFASKHTQGRSSGDADHHTPTTDVPEDASKQSRPSKSMTTAERDARMKEILDDRSGDGGVAGLELEDGRPVAMKRGVRDNMFRLI
ncbi:hypothetical protein FA13DRAFT_757644 [Coprinellus micaceus]|uniref:Uncharacterized protein n=1 Tax=Coprinellus micaceus TaxID=71717 RepID=A0A4Y7SKZ0_COPMI|nr:hypothetical protein FA13DRAFT_1525086 [Coprinellus micaceus]TEB28775.1 hypothetical protein FA13DRAFT_757644 [Coprinellus micaceus]